MKVKVKKSPKKRKQPASLSDEDKNLVKFITKTAKQALKKKLPVGLIVGSDTMVGPSKSSDNKEEEEDTDNEEWE